MTNDLIKELERTLSARRRYRDSCVALKKLGYYGSNPAHASAMRPTMDATKMLAAWRLKPATWHHEK